MGKMTDETDASVVFDELFTYQGHYTNGVSTYCYWDGVITDWFGMGPYNARILVRDYDIAHGNWLLVIDFLGLGFSTLPTRSEAKAWHFTTAGAGSCSSPYIPDWDAVDLFAHAFETYAVP